MWDSPCIFVRSFPFILPEGLCSCVVLCWTSYLASPTVDSLFFPNVLFFVLFYLWFDFDFLPFVCLPFLFLCLIFCYVFLNLWPEVGPDHPSFQHCIKNHRPPEKSWLQWMLSGESLYKGLHLKLKTNFTQKPILFKADASYHRKSKTETWVKSYTDGMSKVRLNPYILAKDPTDLVPYEREKHHLWSQEYICQSLPLQGHTSHWPKRIHSQHRLEVSTTMLHPGKKSPLT